MCASSWLCIDIHRSIDMSHSFSKSLPWVVPLLLLSPVGCEKERARSSGKTSSRSSSAPELATNAEAEKLLTEWKALTFPDNTRQAPAFGQKLAAIGPAAVPTVARFLMALPVGRSAKVVESFIDALGERAIEPLQMLLTAENVDRNTRMGAIKLAGMLGPKGEPLTPALLDWAEHGEFQPLEAYALRALRKIARPAEMIVEVARQLSIGRRGGSQNDAIRLLAVVGSAGDPVQIAKDLVRLLDDGVYVFDVASAIGDLALPQQPGEIWDYPTFKWPLIFRPAISRIRTLSKW